MKLSQKTLLVLTVLVAALGLTLTLFSPSTSLAEPGESQGDDVVTEQTEPAEEPVDGSQKADEQSVAADEEADQEAEPTADAAQGADAAEEGAVEAAQDEQADADATATAEQGEPAAGAPAGAASYSDISMRVVAVNGTAVDPVITYLAHPGDKVTLKAETTAPADSFKMSFGGILGQLTIEVTDAEGNAVAFQRPTDDGGASLPVLVFSNVTPGEVLTITMTGVIPSPSSDPDQLRQCWEGLWYTEGTNEKPAPIADMESYSYKGTAACHLAQPRLSFVVQDTEGNNILPKGMIAESFYTMLHLLGIYPWQVIAQMSSQNNAGLEELSRYISGFALKDAQGNVVDSCTLEEGVSFEFPDVGTYTLDVVRNPGVTFDFTPVPIVVSLAQPACGELTLPMGSFMPNTTLPSEEGSQALIEYVTQSGYRFAVGGKTIPLVSAQELGGFTSLGVAGGELMTISLPAEVSAGSTAVAYVPVDITYESEQEYYWLQNALTMKIIEGSKKVDATTASYTDEVTWETTVDMVSNGAGVPSSYLGSALDDFVVELRYDVNNQNYPTGEGVQPLFSYGTSPSVELVLDNGKRVTLTAGTEYTIESPDGYFRIDKDYVDGEGETVDPNDFNGRWWLFWYEARSTAPQAQNTPYFLHPYFQKQVITLTLQPGSAVTNALVQKIQRLGGSSIEAIVVTNEGNLSNYAFTGGYGNPARALAFSKRQNIYKSPAPTEEPAGAALEPNQQADVAPSYYLRNGGHTCVGFDTTCVYTSAVTVHKVDENKRDLPGAEFTVTTAEGEATNARVIKGQATHLVLSHFIPGFALIRPVPDSVDDVSRRNLTSIGEPAINATSPSGDEVGSEAYLTYVGLEEGSYVITESKAPTGYKSGQKLKIELTADVPSSITSGYEYCRWNASVNGKPVTIVEQLADEYPDVDDDAYQFFSCNSSFIVLRVTNKPNTLTVEKVWSDDDNAASLRTSSVKIQLYSQDNQSAEKVAFGEPVELSDENDWTHTWTMIDESKVWSVEELDVPEGYVATVSGNQSKGFTVTNTIPSEEEPPPEEEPPAGEEEPPTTTKKTTKTTQKPTQKKAPAMPTTGDTGFVQLAGALAALATLALAGSVVARKREQH